MTSSSSQENFLLLIQRQFIYYFVTIKLSLRLHLDKIIMSHLIFGSQKYRKNKKRKLVTSQKYKENKKRATSSKHLFWKWDLSANNHLPNFADYVNAHKSSSECKSSTFNITADIFFSLNKNFLKLRAALSKLLLLTFPILILFLSQHLSINIFLTILLFLVVKLNIV